MSELISGLDPVSRLVVPIKVDSEGAITTSSPEVTDALYTFNEGERFESLAIQFQNFRASFNSLATALQTQEDFAVNPFRPNTIGDFSWVLNFRKRSRFFAQFNISGLTQPCEVAFEVTTGEFLVSGTPTTLWDSIKPDGTNFIFNANGNYVVNATDLAGITLRGGIVSGNVGVTIQGLIGAR